MELSAPRGFRWEIWIPVVTAILILGALAACLLLRRHPQPELADSVRLLRVIETETGETVADESLDTLSQLLHTAGSGEAHALSEKIPPLTLLFSDGSEWIVSFTTRGDTLKVQIGHQSYWLYSEEASRELSRLYYVSTLPEPTPSPSAAPAATPAPSPSPAP